MFCAVGPAVWLRDFYYILSEVGDIGGHGYVIYQGSAESATDTRRKNPEVIRMTSTSKKLVTITQHREMRYLGHVKGRSYMEKIYVLVTMEAPRTWTVLGHCCDAAALENRVCRKRKFFKLIAR